MTDQTVSYFYTPIAFYRGTVLKCGGIVSAENTDWFKAQHPGTIVLEGYRGDRIRADDHTPYTRY